MSRHLRASISWTLGRRALTVSAWGVLVACSSTQTGTGSSSGDVPAPTPTLTKEESEKPASCTDNWVSVAVGKVSTTAGAGVSDAVVGYCVKTDTNLCLPTAKSENGGWYTYRIEAAHRCVKAIVARAEAKESDTGKFSTAYCNLSPVAEAGLLKVETNLTLYPLEAPSSPPSATRQAVKFPSGIELTMAQDDVIEKNLSPKVGAAILDTANPPCFVKPSDKLSMIVAFGPDLNVNHFYDKPKIAFKIPNKAGLAEGSKVEILLLGGFATYTDKDHHLEEGSFGPYGTGTVKGGVIVPDPGSELPALTMIGIRPKS